MCHIRLVDGGEQERFRNLRDMAKETLCICDVSVEIVNEGGDGGEEIGGGIRGEEGDEESGSVSEMDPRQFKKAWDIDTALSGNATASFAEAVQRHDTADTSVIDNTPAEAIREVSTSSNAVYDIDTQISSDNNSANSISSVDNISVSSVRSVTIKMAQPLGLGFNKDLTVVRVEEGSQIGLGSQVKSLAGEKVTTTGELKAVLVWCKEEGMCEAIITFTEPSELPTATTDVTF